MADDTTLQTPQPTVEPPISKGEKLYNNLTSIGLGEKQLGKKDEFLQALQNPIKANKIYSGLRTVGFGEQQLGTLKDFQTAFITQQPSITGVSNTLPLSQPQANLSPVLPENRDEVRQRQNAHSNAIDLAQKQRSEIPPVNQPADKPDRSLMDKIGQAIYLPAIKQGFNELVASPAAGATDFVDRTIDKAYQGITGEKTPEWLRQKGLFSSVSKQIQDEYDTRDKPKNMVSDIAEGVIGTLPLMASMYTGEGEASMAMKAPQLFGKLAKTLAVTKGLTAYKDATDNHEGYLQSLSSGISGAAKGGLEGQFMDAQMLVGGALGKGVANKLEEAGLLKGDKAVKAVLHALSVGTVFGGTSAGDDLLSGKDINTDNALKQFGTGLAFELIPTAKGIHDELSDRVKGAKINNQAAQVAAVANSASNMNGESALRTLMNTPAEQVQKIHNDIPKGYEDLYANSIEQGAKAYEAKDLAEKRDLYTQQLALKAQGDIKMIADQVKKDPTEIIKSINENNEINDEQKADLIDKIQALIPKEKTEQESRTNNNSPLNNNENGKNEFGEQPIGQEAGQIGKEKGGNSPEIKGEEKSSSQSEGQGKASVPTQEEVDNSGADKTVPEIIDPARQKAIDAITHGIIGDGKRKPKDVSPRFDLNIDTEEQERAIRHIIKGKTDSKAASNMIDKVMEFEKKGEYPVIEGDGGSSKRIRFASPEEIQSHIDEAKSYKLAKEQDIAKNNEQLHGTDLTHEDFENYYKHRAELEQSGDGRTVGVSTEDAQRPENDKGASSAQNSGSKAAQGGNEKVNDTVNTTKGGDNNPGTTETVTGAVQSDTSTETKGQEAPKISDKAKELADKIRSLKSAKNNLHGGLQGIGVAVYDGALETVATIIEQGGKLADAIQAGIDHIRANSDLKDDAAIKAALSKDLADAGITEAHDQEQVKTYGTKNSITEELQQGLGLPPIEIPKDRSDDESLAAWKSGKRTPIEITEQLLDPTTGIYDKSITPNDEPIMREYIRQLGERTKELNKIKLHLQEKFDAGDKDVEYDLGSVGVQIDRHLDEYNNALNASKVGGNIWHKYGDERQKAIDDNGLILNAIERIRNIYGTDMPDDVKKQLNDLQKRNDELEAKMAKIIEDAKNKVATETVKSAAKRKTIFGTKKLSDTEFAKVKKDILGDLEKDWKKSFAKTYATLPGIPQFNALAPHITKLVKLYAERNISKLDDVIAHIHNDLKDKLDGITKDDIRDLIAGKYSAKKPVSELRKQVNELRVQARNQAKIEELEKGILAKTKSKGESSPEVKALQKQVAELRKNLINDVPELSAEKLRKEADVIQKKIDEGDFFKTPLVKRTWETNPEWLKSNKEKGDLNTRLKKMEQDAMNSKKSAYMRGLDKTNRWGRRVIFFGANAVYTHLASSAVVGSLLHRWPEFIVGKGINKMFPRLAEGAPIEGNLSLKTEAKFWWRIINVAQTAKNTKDIFMRGETDMSKELSKRPHEDVIPGVDFFAAGGHQAIKDPIVEATTLASQEAYMDYYRSHGIDETHPLMLEAARQQSYNRAQYEIFQNTAKNASIIKSWFNQLEKKAIKNNISDNWYDRVKGNAQYSAKSIYDFMVPINTAPTNMVDRQMLSLRLPDKLIKAWNENGNLKKGIDRLSAEDKDLLLLQLKKGTVGAFYWTLGSLLAGSAAGGLYNKFYSDKDREKAQNGGGLDPQSGYLNLLGTNVPKDWQHNYQFQSLQNGATWSMIYNHYRNDSDETISGSFMKAGFGTTEAISEQVPSIKSVFDLKEAGTTSHGEEKYIKNLKRRIGINKVKDLSKLMGYNIGDDDQ
ncbi:MAG: hypothetical protein JWQ09_5870 [Segetibacter sp.]|nr:hypothetical protein [Segetibacter sp.]